MNMCWETRAFSPQEASDHRLPVEKRRNNTNGYDYLLNSNRFTDGYLVRAFALKSLVTVEGVPDVDELQRFNQVRHLAWPPFSS